MSYLNVCHGRSESLQIESKSLNLPLQNIVLRQQQQLQQHLQFGGPGCPHLSHLPIRSKLCLTKGWVALTARVTS